jgi:hypothetical protein
MELKQAQKELKDLLEGREYTSEELEARSLELSHAVDKFIGERSVIVSRALSVVDSALDALDLHDKFGDDIDARHEKEESAHHELMAFKAELEKHFQCEFYDAPIYQICDDEGQHLGLLQTKLGEDHLKEFLESTLCTTECLDDCLIQYDKLHPTGPGIRRVFVTDINIDCR